MERPVKFDMKEENFVVSGALTKRGGYALERLCNRKVL